MVFVFHYVNSTWSVRKLNTALKYLATLTSWPFVLYVLVLFSNTSRLRFACLQRLAGIRFPTCQGRKKKKTKLDTAITYLRAFIHQISCSLEEFSAFFQIST